MREKFTRDDSKNFFSCVNSVINETNKTRWNPRMLYPGEDYLTVVENLADFFNAISCEYPPLRKEDIPVTFDAPLPILTVSEVEGRIKKQISPTRLFPGILLQTSIKKNTQDLSPLLSLTFSTVCSAPPRGPPSGMWNMSRLFQNPWHQNPQRMPQHKLL